MKKTISHNKRYYILFSFILPTSLITMVVVGMIRFMQYPQEATNLSQFVASMIAFVVISAISIILGLTFKNSN